MSGHSEIEIKLTGNIDKLHAVIQSSKMAPFIRSLGERKYETYYYDTKDNRLIKNNIVLRRRKLETNKNILGLKWRNPNSSLFERGEFEVGINDEKIDLGKFGEIWNQKISQIINDSEIVQKFIIIVRREIYELRSGNAVIEICLDEGEIVTPNKTCAIKEIELELKHGEILFLYDLAINFVENLHLSIELKAKSERGFLLEDERLSKYFDNALGLSLIHI